MKAKKDYGSKPYNRCLSCPHRQIRCDGPRTSAMDLSRWCEFMRDMKEVNGLTNADVSERSGISVKRIEQLMAQNCDQDMMRETARRIENAIIGSSNQYPCYLAFQESPPEDRQQLAVALRELEHALADSKDYKDALDNIRLSFVAEMQAIRDEAKREADFLILQNSRLSEEIDFLRRENSRKAAIIDKYLSDKFESS